MLKRDKIAGSIEWDGADPNILVLKNISKSAAPKVGDTVITSPYSSNFPAQLMVGRVTTVIQDPSSNFLTLNVKASTNFFNLEYVYLVENRRMEDQNKVNIKEAVNE
jgi:rod shape-determining protein MreC